MKNTQITAQSLNSLKDNELLVLQDLLYRCTPLIDEDLANETIDYFNQLDSAIAERFETSSPTSKATHRRAA